MNGLRMTPALSGIQVDELGISPYIAMIFAHMPYIHPKQDCRITARLVADLIEERGICAACKDNILNLYPEKRS